MTRRDNWPALLDAFLAERQARAFCWRSNNCALFAADWVRELTGYDLAEPLRPKVRGSLSAMRIVRQVGGLLFLVNRSCAAAGWPDIPAGLARRGDLVLTATDSGPAVGVSLGHSAAFAGPSGISFKRPADLIHAWQIA